MPGHSVKAFAYIHYFSQDWLLTVQDVLQADWQELWQLPQPPFTEEACKEPLTTCLICFIIIPPYYKNPTGFGAGDGNRTHITGLGSQRSATELHPRKLKPQTLRAAALVTRRGFEPLDASVKGW